MKVSVLLAAGWTLVIFVLISIPTQNFPSVNVSHSDKLVHFTMFFVLGLLWMRTRNGVPRTMWILIAGICFAVLTEVYQGLLPWERSPDPFDAIANALGLMTAVLLYVTLPRVTTAGKVFD